MSGKNSPLEKILELDKEIRQIKRDATYMKLRNGLRKIERVNPGSRFISILSPKDMKKEIRIRRRSKDMRSIRRKYEEHLSKFEERISSLLNERETLEAQIFG